MVETQKIIFQMEDWGGLYMKYSMCRSEAARLICVRGLFLCGKKFYPQPPRQPAQANTGLPRSTRFYNKQIQRVLPLWNVMDGFKVQLL